MNANLKVRKKIHLTFQYTMLSNRFVSISRTYSANCMYFHLHPNNSISGVCPDLLSLLPETDNTILTNRCGSRQSAEHVGC